MKQTTRFRHESLQDKDSIQHLLRSLVEGLAEGKIALEDEDGEIVMRPKGLANLKISAFQDDRKNRLDIRLTWYEDREPLQSKPLRIHS